MENELIVNIFLLDDDYDDISLLRDVINEIENIKFNLDWSYTYSQGIEKLESNNFDVAFIDYKLGAKDGMELIKKLLTNGSETFFFLLTGHGSEKLKDIALKAGAIGFLEKGKINSEILEQTIRETLQINTD